MSIIDQAKKQAKKPLTQAGGLMHWLVLVGMMGGAYGWLDTKFVSAGQLEPIYEQVQRIEIGVTEAKLQGIQRELFNLNLELQKGNGAAANVYIKQRINELEIEEEACRRQLRRIVQ